MSLMLNACLYYPLYDRRGFILIFVYGTDVADMALPKGAGLLEPGTGILKVDIAIRE